MDYVLVDEVELGNKAKNSENRNSQKDSFSWVSNYTGGLDKDRAVVRD